MTNNDPKPDRAQPGDLDGLSDIPTYRTDDAAQADRSGSTSINDRIRSVYQRAGRTAPQSIQPAGDSEKTTSFARPEPADAARNDNLYKVDESQASSYDSPASTAEHTSVLPRPEQEASTIAQPAPAPTPVVMPETVAPAHDAVSYEEYEEEHRREDGRRGTIDFGIAIIRIVTGALLIFNAVRPFFELGGAPGISGLKDEFANYAYPDMLAIAVPAMELAAGVFLLLGLLTPVAAAVATVVTAFNALHQIAQTDNFSFSNPGDSVLLAAFLCALAIGLQFTGPGRLSLDTARSWARRPLASSWILAIVGIAGAVALWWFGAAVNPFN